MWLCTQNLVLPITKIINIKTLVIHSFQIHIWFHIKNLGMPKKPSVAYNHDNQHLDIVYTFISDSYSNLVSYSKCGCVTITKIINI